MLVATSSSRGKTRVASRLPMRLPGGVTDAWSDFGSLTGKLTDERYCDAVSLLIRRLKFPVSRRASVIARYRGSGLEARVLISNIHPRVDGAGAGREKADPTRKVSGEALVCPRCGHALPVGCGNLWPSWLPDPREEPTVPVWPVVGRVLGRKRSAVLEFARRDRLPVRVFRVGRSYRVVTAELLRVLGLENTERADSIGKCCNSCWMWYGGEPWLLPSYRQTSTSNLV
jgi:hypothetical protein